MRMCRCELPFGHAFFAYVSAKFIARCRECYPKGQHFIRRPVAKQEERAAKPMMETVCQLGITNQHPDGA